MSSFGNNKFFDWSVSHFPRKELIDGHVIIGFKGDQLMGYKHSHFSKYVKKDCESLISGLRLVKSPFKAIIANY